VANNNVGRMLCSEPVAIEDKLRIVGRQRTEHCRQCGLATSVFGIDQSERRECNLRRRVKIVELPDIPQ
jgi:hypothetical protein